MAGHGPDTNFYLQLDSISLPNTGAVNGGAPTLQLTPTPKQADGRAVDQRDFAPVYVWASSDPTKATVDQNGLVTKVAAGVTNITCAVTRPKHLGGATVTSNNCAVTVS